MLPSKSELSLNKAKYFLACMERMELRGRKTLPQDYPVPYEEALRQALETAFSGTFFPALEYLIDSGKLDEIILASYNTSTGDFTPQLITSAFRSYFGPQWMNAIQPDIQGAVEDMWDLGEEYMDGESDVEAVGQEDAREDTIAQIVTLGVVASALGAIDQIVYPTASSTARKVFEGNGTLQDLQNRIKEALRIDTPGRATVYYDILSTSLVNRARNFSRLNMAQAMGITTIYWITAGDEKVCPSCSVLDGMAFEVESLKAIVENFVSATTTQGAINAAPWPSKSGDDFLLPNGEKISMDSPADVLASFGIGIPPLHPRCRCDLEIVQTT